MFEDTYHPSQPKAAIILREIEYRRRTNAEAEPMSNYQCYPRAHHNSVKAQYSLRLQFAVQMYRELLKRSGNRFEAATEAATVYDVNYDKLMRIARKAI
jgi:hypothetical protein